MKSAHRLLFAVFAAVAAGCASNEPPPPAWPLPPAPAVALPPAAPAVRETPDAPFRASAPAAGPAIAWSAPPIESWSLANGVRVLFVPVHDLPIVSVRVVTTVGAGDVAGTKPGYAAFMGAMLEQGAGARTALSLSDDYEALGATHAAGCDWDFCAVHAKVLASRLSSALDVLSDIALRPTFPDAEIERLRGRWLASLQQEKNSPPAIEQNALSAKLYGPNHPYGHSLRGSAQDIEKLKKGDLERVWREVFVPRSSVIVVAGDVSSADLKGMLESRFGAWRGGAAVRVPVPRAPRPTKEAAPVVLVDVPNAAQSQVYLAGEGPAASTGDRIPLLVMNAILGGTFSSRINLDLREARSITYGAHSSFAMRHGTGPFAAGGSIFVEHTGEAVKAIMGQIARMRDEPVTAEELADAKEHVKLVLPARFESVDDVAAAVADLAIYGLPLDEYAVRAARVDAISAEDVQRVAKEWLHPEAIRIVVTGDRAKVDKELSAIGTIELRDAHGDPVK